ncbi:MAG: outer membrane beta-barrel protein [Verrucomicrobiota bacterium]
MKKITLPLLASVAFLSSPPSVRAGEYVNYGGGGAITQLPQINVPSLCECFSPNTATFSVYAAGLSPSDDRGELDGSMGMGISGNYFFSENVGIEGDATWFAEDSTVNLITGSIVLRAPIPSLCLAPYAMAGIGVHANGVNQAIAHLGGGVDFRLVNCFGLFADARYTWADETSNYTVIRGGVRFSF